MPTHRTRHSSSRSRSPSPTPETPHEAVSRRVPTRSWNEKDEAHRLSLHRLTYTDARFNPPPPATWKRLALVGLCVVLVWVAFSARLGLWERKREAGREARRYVREHAGQEGGMVVGKAPMGLWDKHSRVSEV